MKKGGGRAEFQLCILCLFFRGGRGRDRAWVPFPKDKERSIIRV